MSARAASRASALRTAADEVARAQIALQRAGSYVIDEIDRTWSGQLWEMRGALEAIKSEIRKEAQAEEVQP